MKVPRHYLATNKKIANFTLRKNQVSVLSLSHIYFDKLVMLGLYG